jgi:hypothetical protein
MRPIRSYTYWEQAPEIGIDKNVFSINSHPLTIAIKCVNSKWLLIEICEQERTIGYAGLPRFERKAVEEVVSRRIIHNSLDELNYQCKHGLFVLLCEGYRLTEI